MSKVLRRLWSEESGQDIAEYAVMLAVILVLVVGTVRLIGSNANNAFPPLPALSNSEPGPASFCAPQYRYPPEEVPVLTESSPTSKISSA